MLVAERGEPEPALLPPVLGVEGGDFSQTVVVTGVLQGPNEEIPDSYVTRFLWIEAA